MTRRAELIVVALIACATIAVYAPVARHAFVDYDDGLFVYANPHVLGGLGADGLVYAFTNWEHRIWAPLTYLSHMADVQVFGVTGERLGLPASGWHHLDNLALHLACTVLLYLLLRTATGARWRSALVAALFALHPLHVESVAWISERKTLLSTLFGLGCLLAYVRYARRPGAARALLVLALLALGLMSKPMLVTWPFVMLLLDFWPLDRMSRASAARLVIEKLPFIALVAASSLVTFLAQRPAMHLMNLVPLGYRIQNAVVACLAYVTSMLWPVDLAALYPYRPSIPAARTALALAFLVVATVAALRSVARRPYLTMGWFWFLGTLVPVSGLVQVGNHSMADRYTYVPLIGLFIAVVWGGAELVARHPRLRAPLAAASVAALAACGAVSSRQLRCWSDTESLFRHTCAVTEPNGEAHNDLGRALAEQGRNDEAIAEFREALETLPRYVEAHVNLGTALAAQGRNEEAEAEWRQALAIEPDLVEQHGLLAASLLERGRIDEAIAEFREAARLQPDDAALRSNLATALARAGRLDEAIGEYREAVRIEPGLVPPRVFLGRALALGGRTDEAIAAFAEAARLEPSNPEILLDLARACADAGRFDEAIAHAERARSLAGGAGSQALGPAIDRQLEAYRRRAAAAAAAR